MLVDPLVCCAGYQSSENADPRRCAAGYHIGVLNTCLDYVAHDLHFSQTNTGAVVVSALLVGAALGSLMAGALADRLGPRTASVLNTLPLFAGITICAAAEQLWSMLLGKQLRSGPGLPCMYGAGLWLP